MAQPKRAGDHFIRFRIPKDEYIQLRDHCHEHDMTVSEMVRLCLRTVMRQEEANFTERKASVRREAAERTKEGPGQEAC